MNVTLSHYPVKKANQANFAFNYSCICNSCKGQLDKYFKLFEHFNMFSDIYNDLQQKTFPIFD